MLSESEIRTIASRYIEPIKNTTADERRLILENALREALMADHRKRDQFNEPNAGCL